MGLGPLRQAPCLWRLRSSHQIPALASAPQQVPPRPRPSPTWLWPPALTPQLQRCLPTTAHRQVLVSHWELGVRWRLPQKEKCQCQHLPPRQQQLAQQLLQQATQVLLQQQVKHPTLVPAKQQSSRHRRLQHQHQQQAKETLVPQRQLWSTRLWPPSEGCSESPRLAGHRPSHQAGLTLRRPLLCPLQAEIAVLLP